MFKNSITLAVVALVVAAGSVAAQQPAAPAAPTVTRTPLLTQDLPMPGGFVATLVSVELPAGAREGRHMHSGTLVAYVKEGALTLDHEGKPTVTYQDRRDVFRRARQGARRHEQGQRHDQTDCDVRVSERSADDDAGERK